MWKIIFYSVEIVNFNLHFHRGDSTRHLEKEKQEETS